MANLPNRRRVWAIAYGLTIVATLPLVLIQQGLTSPVSGQREGVIHLKRGLETVDVDSLLDTNQPDFFLRIEMDKSPAPGAIPAASPTPEASSTDAKESATSALPEPMPSPSASHVPYEWLQYAEEELQAQASPTPTPKNAELPMPAAAKAPAIPASRELGSERLQIVADALYRAPRLAQQGRYQSALEVVDAALGVDDQVAHLHAMRGSICFKLGRERQAEEGWVRALELDPRLSDAQQALDWIRNRRR